MDSPSQYIISPESSTLEPDDVPSGNIEESTAVSASQTSKRKLIDEFEESQDYAIHDLLPPSGSNPSQILLTPDTSILEPQDVPSGNIAESTPVLGSQTSKRKFADDIEEFKDYVIHDLLPPSGSKPSTGGPMVNDPRYIDSSGPASIFLPGRPTKQEWAELQKATRSGFAMTGVATMGKLGPIVGQADIGESDNSYMFRVALPGVNVDKIHFSIDKTGKILVQGIRTTGEKSVQKCSQVFEMLTQNLGPPGEFSITIQLPGPVDELTFTGNFGTDGILEGSVMKKKTD